MSRELKRAIINWLFDNENAWQRINACMDYFKPYIFDEKGNYLIGGREVDDFITEMDILIYSND